MHSDGGKDGSGMHEVNVVPLIDVSLVLVVILMLLTPLASESNIAVHRARAAAAPDEPAEPVVIGIPDDTDVLLNRTRLARADLSAALRPLLAGQAPPAVVVSCDDGVTHGALVNVLDQAKLCGAKAITVGEGID